MARRARLKVLGYPLHVIQRGVDRCATFRMKDDYVLYLGLLNELTPRFDCELHAYVLMTNHVHMLLTSRRQDGVSQLMHRLGLRYVQHFNRCHQRTGPLWSGRFKSCVVDSERYLFACQRYIELNPVRAGMVGCAEHYPWSSHRANAGLEPSTMLVPHFLYEGLGPTAPTRAALYRNLFREELAEDETARIREAINTGNALGDERFALWLEETTGDRARPGVVGRPRRPKLVPPDGKYGPVPGFSGPADAGR